MAEIWEYGKGWFYVNRSRGLRCVVAKGVRPKSLEGRNRHANISRSVQDLSQVLMMATQQSTNLAEKLVKMGAENTINENQLSTMGNLVDTYA